MQNSTGDAGNVTVNAKILELLNGSYISSSTFARGKAGDVIVTSDNLTIDDNRADLFPRIASNAEGKSIGNAGNVEVNAKTLNILNGGQISSSAYAQGNTGNVSIVSDKLTIDKKNYKWFTGVSSLANKNSSGKTGNIAVKAKNSVQIMNGGEISTQNLGSSESEIFSNIDIDSPNIEMKNSQITSNSTGNSAAGNIDVHFSNRLNMDKFFINTTSNTGNGGSINVSGGELIYLKESGFKTTVTGENGNGGDTSTKAQMLVMDTGLIQANAVSGNGGNINLALQALIPSANQLLKGGKSVDWNTSAATKNIIQAASQSGVSGTINNTAPQMNLSGVLANIGNNDFDNRLVSQDYCAIDKGSSLSKKGKGGLPLRAKDLQVY